MKLDSIKKLITAGERVILVENDEPTVVLISFDEYVKMSGSKKVEGNPMPSYGYQPNPGPAREIKEKEEIAKMEKVIENFSSMPEVNIPNKELTLDDLPF